jgi:hypothetical protein
MRAFAGMIAKTVFSVGLSCASLSAATVFTFDSDITGTAPTFTDTVGGLSVTFTSPSDPNGFSIGPSTFSTLTGQILADGPGNASPLPLTLTFSAPLTNISLLFATNSGAGVPLFLNAYSGGAGGTLVGTASASGSIPPGFGFPEGSLSFGGAVFDTIVLSSTAIDFAIDDVSATLTPEPGSWGTAALGLGFIALLYRRGTRTRS